MRTALLVVNGMAVLCFWLSILTSVCRGRPRVSLLLIIAGVGWMVLIPPLLLLRWFLG